MTDPNPMTLPVYCVCLERETERRATLDKRLSELNISPVFVGVDGSNLPKQFKPRYKEHLAQQVFGRGLSKGEIGCYSSHLQIWQMMLANNEEVALILESDAEPDATSISIAQQLVKQTDDWDLLLLYWSECLPSFHGRKALRPPYQLVRFSRKTHTTVAYMVTRRGVEELLAHSEHFVMPVDIMMTGGKIRKNLRTFGVHPRAVKVSANHLDTSVVESGRTTLTGERQKNASDTGLKRFIKKLEFSLRSLKYKLKKPPQI